MGGVDHGFLLQLVTILIAAGAVYGGIRGDLRAMHEAISRIERAAEKAHERIDSMAGGGRWCGQ